MPGFLAWATEWIKVSFPEMGIIAEQCVGNDKSGFQFFEFEIRPKIFITQLVMWV